MSTTTYPKSKRRKMKRFKLEEISVVDKPAQAGAVVTLMKRAGDLIMSAKPTKGQPTPMTTLDDIRKEMKTLGDKLDRYRRGQRKAERADLRNQERARKPVGEEEIWPEGEGPEFEKEPEDEMLVDAAGNPIEDEDELEKERVYRPGRTAAEHEGDWSGAGTRGTARDHIEGTRGDGYVSGDESDEMPSRLGEDEEDGPLDEDELEEAAAEITAKAYSLMKRDPRMSPQRASLMALQRVGDTLDGHHFAKRAHQPLFGREREYLKRAQPQRAVRNVYSDDELLGRLEKRFGAEAVTHHFGRR